MGHFPVLLPAAEENLVGNSEVAGYSPQGFQLRTVPRYKQADVLECGGKFRKNFESQVHAFLGVNDSRHQYHTVCFTQPQALPGGAPGGRVRFEKVCIHRVQYNGCFVPAAREFRFESGCRLIAYRRQQVGVAHHGAEPGNIIKEYLGRVVRKKIQQVFKAGNAVHPA